MDAVGDGRTQRATPNARQPALKPILLTRSAARVDRRRPHPTSSISHLTTMSGFDANRVYSVAVHDAAEPQSIEQPSEIERMLFEFLLQYRVGGEFIYR